MLRHAIVQIRRSKALLLDRVHSQHQHPGRVGPGSLSQFPRQYQVVLIGLAPECLSCTCLCRNSRGVLGNSAKRIRRPGAGRKPAICKDPTLLADLEALVEPTTRGDPESPLRWTCKSVRRLAQALQAQGHQVSRTLVAELLNAAGYSLQANRKTKEGDSHPDRDAQFSRINTQVAAALAEKQPVISVDTKKKELVGDFRNNGREYRPQGNPEAVRVP